MRNAIKFYYNIETDKLHAHGNGYCFDMYYLKELRSNIDFELYDYFINNNIYIYRIIKNLEDKYITMIDNKLYILLIIDKKPKIDLLNINNFFIEMKTTREINWSNLWEMKVDYYEKEMIKIKNKEVLKIFPYYIGLSENAIRVYKEHKNNTKIGVCHKRLDDELDFYSPDNIIVDHFTRDISEYIKKSFFDDKLNINEIIDYIKMINLSSDDYIVFYSRLLFPSYFYDCIENNKSIIKYSSKINQYERLLNILYNIIREKSYIPKIDWIIKSDMN